MAQLPTFRRFTQADIPTAPNWINAVFNPLNVFAEQTVQALKQNLTIGDNVQGAKFTTSFTTPSDYKTANNFVPITFNYTGGGQPNCCLIGNISQSDGTLITDSPQITSWFLNINTNPPKVTINYIAGLHPSVKYAVTFLVL